MGKRGPNADEDIVAAATTAFSLASPPPPAPSPPPSVLAFAASAPRPRTAAPCPCASAPAPALTRIVAWPACLGEGPSGAPPPFGVRPSAVGWEDLLDRHLGHPLIGGFRGKRAARTPPGALLATPQRALRPPACLHYPPSRARFSSPLWALYHCPMPARARAGTPLALAPVRACEFSRCAHPRARR